MEERRVAIDAARTHRPRPVGADRLDAQLIALGLEQLFSVVCSLVLCPPCRRQGVLDGGGHVVPWLHHGGAALQKGAPPITQLSPPPTARSPARPPAVVV